MRRPRGILSFVTGPLPHYAYDNQVLQETNHLLKSHRAGKKRKSEDTAILPACHSQEYDPVHSDFTLLFFAESTSLHSIRFRPILSNFVADTKKDDKPCCQCICIPNNIIQVDRLCAGTGFWCLPLDHPNRAAIIRLLSVSIVPTVVVVDNKTGKRITNLGMQAIESSASPATIVDRWRRGESGLSFCQRVTTDCVVS